MRFFMQTNGQWPSGMVGMISMRNGIWRRRGCYWSSSMCVVVVVLKRCHSYFIMWLFLLEKKNSVLVHARRLHSVCIIEIPFIIYQQMASMVNVGKSKFDVGSWCQVKWIRRSRNSLHLAEHHLADVHRRAWIGILAAYGTIRADLSGLHVVYGFDLLCDIIDRLLVLAKRWWYLWSVERSVW